MMTDLPKTYTVTAAQMYMLRRCKRLISHYLTQCNAPEEIHAHIDVLQEILRDIEGERVVSEPMGDWKECI